MVSIVPALVAVALGGILILALIALGVYLVLRGIRIRNTAGERLRWPSAIGTVEEAEVQEIGKPGADDSADVSYAPHMVYTYEVDGESYRSDRIVPGGFRPTKDVASVQRALTGYPVGGTVTVYYNPDDPSEAILERPPAHGRSLIVVGVICVVMALCLGATLALAVIYYIR